MTEFHWKDKQSKAVQKGIALHVAFECLINNESIEKTIIDYKKHYYLTPNEEIDLYLYLKKLQNE